MDLTVYHALNDYAARHHWFEALSQFFATGGEFVLLVLLALLWLARGRLHSRTGRQAVAAAGFSALLGLAVNQVISHLYERTRPYVHHAHHLFVARSADPSFPSDHATGAFAIAIALMLRHRVAGWIALALALAISIGRVAVGTHYPSDVLGGALIGTAAALVFWTPPLRAAIDRLADWAGDFYERASAAALRRPRPSQP